MTPELTERVLDALWETQWTTRWAAENTVCAYGCSKVAYEDQDAHFEDCDFVKLWGDLKKERRAVGMPENFSRIGPKKSVYKGER